MPDLEALKSYPCSSERHERWKKAFFTNYATELRHRKIPPKLIEVFKKRASAKAMNRFKRVENQLKASKMVEYADEIIHAWR